jgi:hypothetical protein
MTLTTRTKEAFKTAWWLMVFLSAFVGLCTYRMGGNKRPYF